MMRAILIDANSFSRGNMRAEVADALCLKSLKAISSKDTILDDELWDAGAGLYRELLRNNKLIYVCTESVKKKTKQLKEIVRSNDPHVIAVAIASSANILVSNDHALGDDFKNCKSLDQKTGCKPNKQLGRNKDRKIICKTTSRKDVLRLLSTASCKTNRCPCMETKR